MQSFSTSSTTTAVRKIAVAAVVMPARIRKHQGGRRGRQEGEEELQRADAWLIGRLITERSIQHCACVRRESTKSSPCCPEVIHWFCGYLARTALGVLGKCSGRNCRIQYVLNLLYEL